MPLDPEITTGKLPNGLAYYIAKVVADEADEDRYRVALAIDAGTADATMAEADATTILGHAFRNFVGTEVYSDDQVSTFGVDATLVGSIIGDDDWDRALKGLRKVADGVRFDRPIVDIDAEIAEAKRSHGRIGRDDDGERFDPRSLAPVKAYYRKWYRADRMAVIVVGDVDPALVVRRITDRFGSLATPKEPPPERGRLRPVSAPGPLVVDVTPTQDDTLALTQRFPHHRARGEVGYRARLVDRFLLATIAKRFGYLVEDDELLSIETARLDATHDTVTFRISWLDTTLPILLQEIERLRVHGVDQVELDAWSATEAEALGTEELVVRLAEHARGDRALPSRAVDAKLRASLTLAEVNAACRALETERGRSLAGSDLRTPEQLRDLDAASRSEPLAKWSELPALQPLVDPKPGTITSTTTVQGLTIFTLGNGARVIVQPLPSEILVSRVQITALGPGGWTHAPKGDELTTFYAPNIVLFGGIGDFTEDKLIAALRGRTVEVNGLIHRQTHEVTVTGDGRKLETMMALMHLAIAKPRKDADAFAKWKAAIATQGEPERPYHELLVKLDYLEGDYSEPMATRSAIDAIDLDRVYATYVDHTSDMSTTTFLVTGDLPEPAVLADHIAKYLASIPPGAKRAAPRNVPIPKAKLPATSTFIGSTFVIADYIKETVPLKDAVVVAADQQELQEALIYRLSRKVYSFVDAGVSAARTRYMRVRIMAEKTPKDIQVEIDRLANEPIDENTLAAVQSSMRSQEFFVSQMRNGMSRGEDPVKLAEAISRRSAQVVDGTVIAATAKRYTKPTVVIVGTKP